MAAKSYLVLIVYATPLTAVLYGTILLSKDEVLQSFITIGKELHCAAIFRFLQRFLTEPNKHFIREEVLFIYILFKNVS